MASISCIFKCVQLTFFRDLKSAVFINELETNDHHQDKISEYPLRRPIYTRKDALMILSPLDSFSIVIGFLSILLALYGLRL